MTKVYQSLLLLAGILHSFLVSSQSLGTSTAYTITPTTYPTGVTRALNVDIQKSTGKVVYVFADSASSGSNRSVKCVIYDKNMSNPVSFRVNKLTAAGTTNPRIKVNQQDNSFVVTWSSNFTSGNLDIYAKKISFSQNLNSVKDSADIRINKTTTGDQLLPIPAFDYFRNQLVIVWRDNSGNDGNGLGTFMRKINYNSTRLDTTGNDIQVNQYYIGTQGPLAADFSPVTGELITICGSQTSSGSVYNVVRRVFVYNSLTATYDGQAETIVNTALFDKIPLGLLINSLTGDYCIAWGSNGEDGSGYGVYAEFYNKNHTVIKSKFQVSDNTIDNQISPRMTWDETNNIIFFFYVYSSQSAGTSTIRYRMYNTSGTYTAVAPEADALQGENTKSYWNQQLFPILNPFNNTLYLGYDVFQNYAAESYGRARTYTYTPPVASSALNVINYAELKNELDASFHSTLNKDTLYFKYHEKYFVGTAGAPLNYKIYDYKRNLLVTPVLTKTYGMNYFRLGLKGILTLNGTNENYYILEVTNDKGEVQMLRFKYTPDY